MGTMSYADVDEILRIIDQFPAAEVRFEHGDLKLYVKRAGTGAAVAQPAPQPVAPVAAAAPPSAAPPAPHAALPVAVPASAPLPPAHRPR